MATVLIAAYAYYRIAISPTEAFGPLYEWLAATIIALLLILYFTNRSSSAVAEKALPPGNVRFHRQSVKNLRDPDYEILRGLVASFISRGTNGGELGRRLSSTIPWPEAQELIDYEKNVAASDLRSATELAGRKRLIQRLLSRFEVDAIDA